MLSASVARRCAAVGAFAALGGFAAGFASPGGWAAIAALVAAVCLAAAAGYLALVRSARAVHAVRLGADAVAEGRWEGPLVEAPEPVSELTHAFNAMTAHVRQLLDGLAADEARLRAVFDASTNALAAVGRDGTLRSLNPTAATLFDTDPRSAPGQPFIQVARDYELAALVREASSPGARPPARIITFGPQRLTLQAAAVGVENGGEWAVLLILTDLTELQRFDRIRRDFVSNVSHELRTPLASIRALVETLEDDNAGDPETEREFLRRIARQTARLSTLVDELLELSRAESGALPLRPEPIDLRALVDEASALLATTASASGVVIKSESNGPAIVEADRAALLRIVTNLLDNAIRHSPQGAEVFLRVGSDGDLVPLAVTDHGDGIPAPDLDRVFERFFKGDSSRATAGSGLGLAIVKHYVRAHGGAVSARNNDGPGATFTVHLPRTFAGRRP